MTTDPISDYLTRLRNAISAKHKVVEIPASNVKREMTQILMEKGYILNYKVIEDNLQGKIKIALKYDKITNDPVIKKLQRVSKPGLRIYKNTKGLPKVLGGLGVAIISTSKGVMSDRDARKQGIGGEVLCYVY